jgi:hypothetical protein
MHKPFIAHAPYFRGVLRGFVYSAIDDVHNDMARVSYVLCELFSIGALLLPLLIVRSGNLRTPAALTFP